MEAALSLLIIGLSFSLCKSAAGPWLAARHSQFCRQLADWPVSGMSSRV